MRQGVGEILLSLGHPSREIVVLSGILRDYRTIGAAAIEHAVDRKTERVQAAVLERRREQMIQEKAPEALEVRADHADWRDKALDQEFSGLRVHTRYLMGFAQEMARPSGSPLGERHTSCKRLGSGFITSCNRPCRSPRNSIITLSNKS